MGIGHPGLWFEEFEVGAVHRHSVTRTVTETDNVMFTCMTMNPQPLHLDAAYAAESEFGERIVNSLYTLALLVGLTVADLTLRTTIANLGFESVTFPKPVFHGDTIRAETRVIAVRPSGSRPSAGVVTLEHVGLKQTDDVVAVARRSALVRRAPRDDDPRRDGA
jgi:acyl dehydratase